MTKSIKCLILFLTATFAFANAATFNVQLFQASMIEGKELKPGEYKLSLDNEKVVIKKGKESVEASVKVENAETKFVSTSVRYVTENGKMKVQEIRLGGTNTKVVFN